MYRTSQLTPGLTPPTTWRSSCPSSFLYCLMPLHWARSSGMSTRMLSLAIPLWVHSHSHTHTHTHTHTQFCIVHVYMCSALTDHTCTRTLTYTHTHTHTHTRTHTHARTRTRAHTHTQNDTVEVQFWAGNPRNNLMVNLLYGAVQVSQTHILYTYSVTSLLRTIFGVEESVLISKVSRLVRCGLESTQSL